MKAVRERFAVVGAALALVSVAVLAGCGAGDRAGAEGGEVNVYSHRHYDTDQELFDRFTEATGIEVNVITASADELITRLEREGEASPADVLITVDVGRLHRARERGLLQPVESEALESNVPASLRDPEGHWYGLTQRARIIAYDRERVDPADVPTYEALAQSEWRGRVLIRSSSNVYNQSLMASLIAHNGADAATAWAEGVVANMARDPSGGDTDQLKAVAAGEGDLAVANTYYLARLATSDSEDDRRVAERLGVIFPNQGDRGAHVNVSGAGVTASASNVENAVRLLEFLSGEEAQRLFAEANHEYPVNPAVAWSSVLQEWGEFEADTLNLSVLGELNDEAVRVFDRAGWR